MIRFAKPEDKQWIIDLLNDVETEEYHTAGLSTLLENIDSDIENKRYLIDDEGLSFARYDVLDDCIFNHCLLTTPEHRRQNYARSIYVYELALYRKPIKYNVIKDSESEQMWAKRNEYVISTTDKIGEEEIDGRTYCIYVYNPWKVLNSTAE